MTKEDKPPRYDILYEHVPAAIAVIEVIRDERRAAYDFIFKYMNEKYAELEGFSLEAAKNKTFYTLFPLADKKLAEIYGTTASTGKKSVTNMFRPEIGKYLHIECTSLQGDTCVCLIIDMTDGENLRRRAEAERQSVMEAMSTPEVRRWVYDIKAGTSVQDDRSQKELGLPHVMRDFPASWLETNIVLTKYWKTVLEGHRRLRDGEKEVGWEQQIWPPTQKAPVWEHVTYTTIFDNSGHPVRAVGTAVDITKQKRLEAEFQSFADLQNMFLKNTYSAFKINVTQNTAEAIKDPVSLLTDAGGSLSLSDFFERAAARAADPVSLVRFSEIFSRAALLDGFKSGRHSFETECRYKAAGGEKKWLALKVILAQHHATGDIMGFAYSSDISEKKTNETAIQSIVARHCDLAVRINVKTGQYTVLFKTPESFVHFDSNGVYEDEISALADSITDSARLRRSMKEALSIQIITQTLILKDAYAYSYETEHNCTVYERELNFFYMDRNKYEICMTRRTQKTSAASAQWGKKK